jgi:hypothetical protein
MKWRLPKLRLPSFGRSATGRTAPRARRWRLDFDLDRNPTLARVRSLPPAGKVAVAAIALLLTWMALEQFSWSWARSWGDEAERIERALSDSSELASSEDPVARNGAEVFGPVDPPRGESQGAEAMARAVVEVVKKHAVNQFSFDAQRASTRLSGGSSAGPFGNQKLSKVTGELQFEATPAETAKIIAELESSPAIDAVSALRMQRRENEGKVMVRLTVEAWVFASKSSSGRMG